MKVKKLQVKVSSISSWDVMLQKSTMNTGFVNYI
jgi:hypothetical protein